MLGCSNSLLTPSRIYRCFTIILRGGSCSFVVYFPCVCADDDDGICMLDGMLMVGCMQEKSAHRNTSFNVHNVYEPAVGVDVRLLQVQRNAPAEPADRNERRYSGFCPANDSPE